MNIEMSCMDTDSAPLDVRELFACTKSNAANAMHEICQIPGVLGCIVYSTCNRTEIWIDMATSPDKQLPVPAELLCIARNLPYEAYSKYFVTKRGRNAVCSLFSTAAGLSSRIWGESQILGQVKDALALAIAEKTGDRVLNKLFQYAIAAAKEIRTTVRIPDNHASVASEMVSVLRNRLIPANYQVLSDACSCSELTGIRILVIGSGNMGRSAAEALVAAGGDVTITLGRHHKSSDDVRCIPAGCKTVPYDGRTEIMDAASVIVSATTSPHYTVRQETVAELTPRSRIFVDLAVPRDIEPGVADLKACTLLTIDDIPCRTIKSERQTAFGQAAQVIERYVADFYEQIASWECLPEIELLAGKLACAVEDFVLRELSGTSTADRKTFAAAAGSYAGKKSQSLLFTFRSWIDENKTASEGISR